MDVPVRLARRAQVASTAEENEERGEEARLLEAELLREREVTSLMRPVLPGNVTASAVT